MEDELRRWQESLVEYMQQVRASRTARPFYACATHTQRVHVPARGVVRLPLTGVVERLNQSFGSQRSMAD